MSKTLYVAHVIKMHFASVNVIAWLYSAGTGVAITTATVVLRARV